MKKFKKLIPAFCMLLISAVLMGTSTYAWFSMNKTVHATGMQVTAKSNSEYLLIGAGTSASASDIQTGKLTTVDATYATTGNIDKKVYPVAYYAEAGTLGGTTTQPKSWYTANSDKVDETQAGADAKNVSNVTEGDKDHMLTYTVRLTLSKDSVNVSKKIKVTATFNSADASVHALVIFGDTAATSDERLLLNSAATEATTANVVALAGDATVLVTVYVYIDGNSTNVNSEHVGTHTITGNLALQFDLVD